MMSGLNQEMIDKIRLALPQKIAEDLCSVQPIDIDFEKLANDPLANAMLTRFFNRCQKTENKS